MRIAIISDTHDNRTSSAAALSKIRELGITTLIHCGDICAPYMLELFSGLDAKFVYGNNDWDEVGLRTKTAELGFELSDSLELDWDGKRILVCHGDRELILDHALQSQSFAYVFRGHTHIASNELIGKTRLVNPGALHRAKEYSFATLDLSEDWLEFHPVAKS